MKLWTLLLFSISAVTVYSQTQATDFEGDYFHRHSLYMASENKTVHGVEDRVRIRPLGKKEAQILIETYTHNFHSCQLIGKAHIEDQKLVFRSKINPKLNQGKKANCILSIAKVSKGAEEEKLTIEDHDDVCKLQYCGMAAQLNGQFQKKPAVQVQDKN